jgi:hypothetical protein
MLLAGLLLVPGLATLWTAWQKFNVPVPPEPVAVALTGLGGTRGQPVLCLYARALSPP